MSSHPRRTVISVELSLRGIFVLFAIYSIMIMRKRRFFIVKGVGFVELEEEKISFIVIHVSVA